MANEEMQQYWTDSAAGWVANERIFDTVFAPVTEAILAAAAVEPGHRLLDVGCGSGSLLAAGQAVAAAAVGIDISPVMAEAARRRVPQAMVVLGDAQVVDLRAVAPGPPFDRVVSRFGVMFFADPVAAFANLRAATAPGARIAFACWRGRAENPMFTLGTSVLADRLDPEVEPPPDAPGPTAFADRDRLSALLAGAGWSTITIDHLDIVCDYGIDGSDGVAERLATILGGRTGRLAKEQLAPRLGPAGWSALLAEVRAELRRHRVDGVVRFPGALWLATAQNPAVQNPALR